jgi:predicted amidohydrolase YtcJ
MNPLAALVSAGVEVALSSDAPVTPLDPWGAIRAAVGHHTPAARLDVAAAFDAATRGGWHAARAATDGALAAGRPATFAAWHLPAGHIGPPGAPLPDLRGPDPVCLRTVLDGVVLHEAEVAPAA